MMNNLFSVFDPTSHLGLSLNWMSAMIFLLLTPLYWATPNKTNIMANKMFYTLHFEFKMLLGTMASNGSTLMFTALLFLIAVNNFMGLFPYIFTASSHLLMALTLSLPIWMALMCFGWINKTNHMFSHLVPQSTPGALMPFMVVIESISNLIRPMTLAVRLMANMVAGHLLMTLLGNQTASSTTLLMMSLIFVQILLLTLESAVSLIQAYVFAVLSTLYASEITSH